MTRQVLPSLSKMQTVYVEATRRYRVVTAGSLRVMLQESEEAAEKALHRLDKRGWLHQLRLPDRQCCYTLSRQAVLHLGLSKKALKSMGPAAVITNLAMIYFCARQRVERLTAEEIRATYPDLDRPGLQVGNYFSDYSVDPPRLNWMLVDRAFKADVLVQKVGKVLKGVYRFPSLIQLAQSCQFGIAVLVPNDRKKWLVERVLAKKYFPQIHVTVYVVPEIQSLLLS
jgi:hypothetical protein